MSEITLGAHVYRIGKLHARAQFDLMRRLGPALPVFWQEKRDGAEVIDGARWLLGFTSGAMAEMKQADSDYVLDACLGVVARRGGADPARPTWVPVSAGARMVFEDIGVMTMMELVDRVLQENLADFFAQLRGGSAAPAAETETGGGRAVRMSTGRDWLMRPVIEGLITYDKLLDRSLSLDDIAEMNEALDVRDENSRKK